MRIKILFFSVIRDRLGQTEKWLTLPENASGKDLLDHLTTEFPDIAPFRSVIRLGVNQVFCAETVQLMDGDHVALITPVSGG
ncbi:MAG: MoaD/ThiS family protein [Rhodothermia bacterium]|nr:MoaD/ThiS family protein [Rhodothermia bacterium]